MNLATRVLIGWVAFAVLSVVVLLTYNTWSPGAFEDDLLEQRLMLTWVLWGCVPTVALWLAAGMPSSGEDFR